VTEPTHNPGALHGIFRSWFELTHDEQKVLLLILALFLLGLAVRFWHLKNETDTRAPAYTSQAHAD